MNAVTIYTNGIAAFSRTYKMTNKTPVELVVRKDHVSDVLSSLSILGDVKLTQPPSFTPTTNVKENLLQIPGTGGYIELLKQLSGNRIKMLNIMDIPLEGVLVSVQSQEVIHKENKVFSHQLIVDENGKLRTFNFDQIKSIEFIDPQVKAEIDKALKNNREKTKNESRVISLELSPESAGEKIGILQYCVPTAAWTITYRINRTGDKYELQAYAVIHNNTDEDWDNFQLSVVTGEPFTFSSDLNEQKQPARNHISFVKNSAEGGGTADNYADSGGGLESVGSSMSRGMSFAACAPTARSIPKSAKIIGAASEDVGDFTIWTSAIPVNIKSQKSALIPLFSADLNEVSQLLHYKASQNADRPFRAVKIKNDTEWSLGSGPCVIYNNNISEGTCVFNACKPGETQLLLHASETGVRVKKEAKRVEDKQTAISTSSGNALIEYVKASITDYKIKNNKKETFLLQLDHEKILAESKLEISVNPAREVKDLKNSRFMLELKGGEEVTLSVKETLLVANKIVIDVNWVKTILQTNSLLANDEKVKNILACAETVGELQKQIEKYRGDINKGMEKQARLRENLKAFVSNSEEASGLRKSLLAEERNLEEIEVTKIPGHENQLAKAKKELQEALIGLTVSWKS